ncbi:hypothetical protein O4G76_17335 [Limimaricola sp. G21655-S1]|uniref:hypothetical protein n=1 Tax=Limimaricola sp. G21655-S1 TaxID=3014768 RepID=UPI0022AFADAE|nr:hypothetical protein [Limimaricola sp. G21655-S1]MCZ4262603.1 hypothetical protein [Limimaricola sp. G21655-S1]
MTKTNQNKSNTGGRPLSYDPNLVHEIISAGLASGLPAADLDASYVKERLCGEYGVKGSIRQETLESLVETAHAEIREAENRALLAKLPKGTAAAVSAAVAATEKELLLVVAQQHAGSLTLAKQECDELRADKRNAQNCMAILEGALAEKEVATRALEKERDKLAGDLAKAHEELRIARADLERLTSEQSGVGRLFAELRNPENREDIRAVLADLVAPAPSEEPK